VDDNDYILFIPFILDYLHHVMIWRFVFFRLIWQFFSTVGQSCGNILWIAVTRVFIYANTFNVY